MISKYDFTEYARDLVKDWPPLTSSQLVKLHHIFNPGESRIPKYEPTEAELRLAAERAEFKRRQDIVQRYAESLLQCVGCGRTPEHHYTNEHPWTPMGEVVKVAESAYTTGGRK